MVSYHDPFVPSVAIDGGTMKSVPLTDATLSKADVVVILTDHTSIDYERVVKKSKLVFDSRNATGQVKTGRSKIVVL